MKQDIADILAASNLRITAPRRAVFHALQDAAEPLSVADIVRLCPDIDRVSVYRTIDAFLAIHIIITIPLGWKQRYELAAPLKPHHHHLYCVHCKTATEIASDKVEALIDQISKTYTFQTIGHTFELEGICQNCKTLNTQ